jgi:hopanoid biosynthesis associated protein HpnK
MKPRRLIVNADDLGLDAGINAGVLRAHSEGIVTSASLSVVGAAFDDAVARLQAAPRLSVGVHLTLVAEQPVSSPDALPTLAPGGRLPSYFTGLFRRLWLGRIREEDVERELDAQVQKARDAGVRVSHLDSHQHVHLHPTLLPIVLRVARRHDVDAVRAARRVRPLGGVRPALLAGFSRLAARRVRRTGLKTADVCLGIEHTGRLDESRLLRLLADLPEGTAELVCHPGESGEAIARRYPDWGFHWDAETAALTSPRVREALDRSGAQVISYRDL